MLLGFINFLSFQAYDDTRAGAGTQAVFAAQMVQTALLMPAGSPQQLTGELICCGRSVVGTEWDAVGSGSVQDSVHPWGAALFRTVAALEPAGDTEQSAYDRWMSRTSQRQEARNDRVHTAQGIISTPLWLALYHIGAVVFGYLPFFADSAERATTQAVLMGSVTVVITVLMLLLGLFDNPHGEGVGRLQPTAMERSLRIIDNEVATLAMTVTPPCDQRGSAVG